jgi:cytosine/adenosine deaminase-related metal-dependent hydrolase
MLRTLNGTLDCLHLPGLNGYLEMQQLQESGLSLAQIFRVATISKARKFKIDSQLGTIEPDKIANLVLLKRSPLESMDAYDSTTASPWFGFMESPSGATVWLPASVSIDAYRAPGNEGAGPFGCPG